MTEHISGTIPPTITLAELAILAGRAGHSVVVGFADYTAPILAATWGRLAGRVAAPRRIFIEAERDLKRLRDAPNWFHLVLVRNPRLFEKVAWLVELSNVSSGPRPAVFVDEACTGLDSDPAATLALRADESEVDHLGQWLRQPPAGPPLNPEASITTPPPALLDTIANLGWREQQVITAIVCGAHLHRVCGMDLEGRPPVAQVDYSHARTLLQCSLVRNGGGHPEELATAMVGRANVYLVARYGPHRDESNPFAGRRQPPPTTRRGQPIPITRRELADLGNTKSKLVRDLLQFVRCVEGGREQYQRMGLAAPTYQKMAWPPPVDLLRRGLRTWTIKQVRTRFDRMVRDGLITAQRSTANGPWEYVLPDEVNNAASPYAALPEGLNLQG